MVPHIRAAVVLVRHDCVVVGAHAAVPVAVDIADVARAAEVVADGLIVRLVPAEAGGHVGVAAAGALAWVVAVAAGHGGRDQGDALVHECVGRARVPLRSGCCGRRHRRRVRRRTCRCYSWRRGRRHRRCRSLDDPHLVVRRAPHVLKRYAVRARAEVHLQLLVVVPVLNMRGARTHALQARFFGQHHALMFDEVQCWLVRTGHLFGATFCVAPAAVEHGRIVCGRAERHARRVAPRAGALCGGCADECAGGGQRKGVRPAAKVATRLCGAARSRLTVSAMRSRTIVCSTGAPCSNSKPSVMATHAGVRSASL